MQCFRVSPIKQINTRYQQVTQHDQMTVTQKDNKYNYSKNRRSYYSRTTQQKLDVVEISAQGLNALKQYEPSAPPTEIGTTNISYISKLIANYEK